VAVFVRVAPELKEEETATVKVKTASPGLNESIEQETVPFAPTAGVVQDHPPGDDRDTKVVSAGKESDRLTLAATLGPALFAVMVYVRLFPVYTGSGAPMLVTERSADAATVVVAVPLSFPGFGSEVVEEAVAVFDRTVPSVTDGSTCTVKENTALPTASDAIEHDTVPPAPTAGVVQDQPGGGENDTNVVPAGRVSDKDALAASLGPAFVVVIV
jgi:hypothetical protein